MCICVFVCACACMCVKQGGREGAYIFYGGCAVSSVLSAVSCVCVRCVCVSCERAPPVSV